MVRSGRRRVGYFGSKATAGLWQPLISMMPPHDVYIESHLGGGAIMQRKPPALRNIGIDPDARVIESFRCDYPVELVHGCAHRFLAGFPFRGRELVYADPPYLHEVRRGPRRYRYEYERSDHVALLDLLVCFILRYVCLICRFGSRGRPELFGARSGSLIWKGRLSSQGHVVSHGPRGEVARGSLRW